MWQVKEAKGLDMVRRDWCGLAKDCGNFALDEILSGKSCEEVVDAIHAKLQEVLAQECTTNTCDIALDPQVSVEQRCQVSLTDATRVLPSYHRKFTEHLQMLDRPDFWKQAIAVIV